MPTPHPFVAKVNAAPSHSLYAREPRSARGQAGLEQTIEQVLQIVLVLKYRVFANDHDAKSGPHGYQFLES